MISYRITPIRASVAIVGLLLLVGATGTGYWYGVTQRNTPNTRGLLLRSSAQQLPHINPLLMCEVSTQEVSELLPVKHAVEATYTKYKNAGDIQTASVYVRLLNSARWFEINPEEKYTPASLLKPAVLIAYLRIAEITPEILAKTITFKSQKIAVNPVVPPTRQLIAGRDYTIGDYLNQLIIESDNQALTVLRTYLTAHHPQALEQTYKDLSLPNSNDPQEESITPRIYSRLFTLLYNATYLGKETSEAGIELLLASSYKHGLVAGVPQGVPVAHKFGERAIANPTGDITKQEFHDCGIVYYPEHPYFICIMTKGKDFERMQQTIASISKTTYEQLDSFFKAQSPSPLY
jgi:beta-lactamase class A